MLNALLRNSEYRWLVAQPKPNDTVDDGGGHIGGYFHYCAKKMRDTGRIISVECDLDNLTLLSENVALVKQASDFDLVVQVLGAALGNRTPVVAHQRADGMPGDRSRIGQAQQQRRL